MTLDRSDRRRFATIGAAFLITGLGMAACARSEYARQTGFKEAATGTATILGRRVEIRHYRKGEDVAFNMLRYQYVVGRKTFVAESAVGQPLYNAVSVGQTVPVFYRRDHPEDGVLEKPTKGWALLLLAIPFSGVGAWLMIAALRGRLGSA